MSAFSNDPIKEVKVGSKQPIDDIVSNLMSTVAQKGRGFVLGLNPDGTGKTAVEVTETLRPHDEWQPPTDYRAHTIDDTDSFIAYCLRYGIADFSLVLCAANQFTLVINDYSEAPGRGERETINMPVKTSDDWKEWTQILNKKMGHRELLNFLMKHDHNLTEGAVLKSMEQVKLNSTINVESDIKDDGQTVGVTMKTTAGESLAKFPKSFGIVIPILDSDVDADINTPTTIKLQIEIPKEARDGIAFTLISAGWNALLQARIRQEADKVRRELEGWTVVQGSFCIKTRILPGEPKK